MPRTNSGIYAPASYIQAPAKKRRDVCNGCGTEGWKGEFVPNTIYGLDISEACDIHDWMYFEGKSPEEKQDADTAFLVNMLRIVRDSGGCWVLKALRRRRALKYYESVVMFGGPAFWDCQR